MQFTTLTTTLTHFINAFSAGYERIAPIRNGLLGSLLAIEIVLIGCWMALDGGDRMSAIIKKILFLGVWIWITTSFPTLAKAFVDSLIRVGLTAGGRPGNMQLLLDPSRIAGYGLDATVKLSKALDDVGFDLVDAVVFGLSYIAIMLSFLIVAVQVFLAVLEYYLMLALVGIFLPFGILPQTKFLAEKAIAAIVASGVKLMVLAFILAIADPILRNIRFAGSEITFNELWSVLLTSGGIALLAWRAPSFAAGLLSGSPSLGAGDVAQHASAGAMLAGGVVAGAVGATKAATSVAATAGGHVARAAGFATTSAQLGGGAGGVASNAGAALWQGAKAQLSRASGAIGGHFRSGSESAVNTANGGSPNGGGNPSAPKGSHTDRPSAPAPAWAGNALKALRRDNHSTAPLPPPSPPAVL